MLGQPSPILNTFRTYWHWYFSFIFLSHSSWHKFPWYLNVTRTQTAKKCLRNHIPSVINSTPLQIIHKMYTHSYHGFSNYAKHRIIYGTLFLSMHYWKLLHMLTVVKWNDEFGTSGHSRIWTSGDLLFGSLLVLSGMSTGINSVVFTFKWNHHWFIRNIIWCGYCLMCLLCSIVIVYTL